MSHTAPTASSFQCKPDPGCSIDVTFSWEYEPNQPMRSEIEQQNSLFSFLYRSFSNRFVKDSLTAEKHTTKADWHNVSHMANNSSPEYLERKKNQQSDNLKRLAEERDDESTRYSGCSLLRFLSFWTPAGRDMLTKPCMTLSSHSDLSAKKRKEKKRNQILTEKNKTKTRPAATAFFEPNRQEQCWSSINFNFFKSAAGYKHQLCRSQTKILAS